MTRSQVVLTIEMDYVLSVIHYYLSIVQHCLLLIMRKNKRIRESEGLAPIYIGQLS